MPMMFKLRPSHAFALLAGYALAAWKLPAVPSLFVPVSHARAEVAGVGVGASLATLDRQLTSGHLASVASPTIGANAANVEQQVIEEAHASDAAAAPRKKRSGRGKTPAARVGDSADDSDESAMHRSLRTSVAVRVGPSYGAGVLVSSEGLILTVNHVLEEDKPIRVSVAGLAWQDAKVVARDAVADLALLQVKLPSEGPHRAAPLGTVTGCRAGDEIFTIGSPASMHFSLTRGVLSFVGRRFGGFRYLQTDLPIQPGNSGGPLFNEDGEVVGLMTFVIRNGQNLGFAIPIDYARSRFAQLEAVAATPPEESTFSLWASAKIESPL